MKLRVPEYYKEFKCIADKCKDTCCKSWEIDIDKKTSCFYASVKGDFGRKLENNISKTEPKHFILNNNGKCPFLNECNLCEIFIKLGEENLCDICSIHPRYFEWFANIKEGGIGLCCEEAARIILSQNTPFKTFETEIEFESCDEYDKDLFSLLYNLREKLITYLGNSSIPFNLRICNILKNAGSLQKNIDSEIFSKNFDFTDFEYNSKKNDLKPLLNFFLRLEYLDNNWKQYLRKCIKKHDVSLNNFNDFENSNPQIDTYLQNIAVYFIWRYFLKGVFDCDIWSKVNLMAVSLIFLKYLFFCKWLENGSLSFDDCVIIAKKYSQEIEYSDNNLETLASAAYDNFFFSAEYLIGINN